MAKPLTTKWQEAVGMMAHCTVEAAAVHNTNTLQIVLKDPTGQKFGVQAVATVTPGVSGNLLTLNTAFNLVAIEVDKGEYFAGVEF